MKPGARLVTVERLDFLVERLGSIAEKEPHLTGSERASLLWATQLVRGVRDGQVARISALN